MQALNTNKDKKLINKPADWWAQVQNEEWQYFPEKLDWRNRLIYSMYRFFENPDALLLEEFCWEYKIHRDTLDKWARKYPDIKEAKDRVKIFIAMKRRKGVMKNELNAYAAFRDMHCYDPQWAAVDNYHSDLKKEENSAIGIERIVLPAIETTDEVDEHFKKKALENS